MVWVTRHRVRTGHPLRRAVHEPPLRRVPLLFAKGTFAERPERIRVRKICVAFPVVLPFWMEVTSVEAPVFAGMRLKGVLC